MRVSGLVSRRFWTKKSNCKPARSTGQSCLKVIQSHKIVYRPKDLCREDPIHHQTEIKLELQNKKWRVRFHPSQGWDLKTSTQRSRNYQRSVVAQTPKPAEPEEASVECRDPREPPEKDLKPPLLHRPDPLLTLRLRNQCPSPWPPQHHTEPAGVRGNLSASFSVQHSWASSLLHRERLLLLTFCWFLLCVYILGLFCFCLYCSVWFYNCLCFSPSLLQDILYCVLRRYLLCSPDPHPAPFLFLFLSSSPSPCTS